MKYQPGTEPQERLSGQKVGVLLLHGYTSSPREFIDLIEFLESKNYDYLAPRLPGHGLSVRQLNNVTLDEIIDAAQSAYQRLAKNSEIVYIVGNSAGCNLAVVLATEKNCEARGLVLLAPWLKLPLHFSLLINFVLPFASIFIPSFPKFYKRRIREKIKLKNEPYYNSLPLKGLRNVKKLMRKMKKLLPEVNTNLLALQSQKDYVLADRNLESINNLVNSDKVIKIKKVHADYHVFINDIGKKEAISEIDIFIQETI